MTDADAPAVNVSQQAVRAIRRSRPDAHITVTCPSGLAPAWQEPGVDAFVPWLPRDARFDAAFVFVEKTPPRLRRIVHTILTIEDDPHAPADLTQARLRLVHRAGGITT
jgi:hypothetical protein